jgi:hypothetical protein
MNRRGGGTYQVSDGSGGGSRLSTRGGPHHGGSHGAVCSSRSSCDTPIDQTESGPGHTGAADANIKPASAATDDAATHSSNCRCSTRAPAADCCSDSRRTAARTTPLNPTALGNSAP